MADFDMTVTAKIKLPRVPNYLLSPNGTDKFPIGAFSEQDLERIGRDWTDALLARARWQRDNGYAPYKEPTPSQEVSDANG